MNAIDNYATMHGEEENTSAIEGPVLIIGAGLLGASVGLALRAQGVPVYLSDVSPTVEAVAQDIGAGISLSSLAGQQGSGGQDAAHLLPQEPQLVVVAAPPDVVATVVIEQLNTWSSATVIDIASVKAPILAEVLASGADATRYVGTHPMAGREKS